MTPLYFGSLFAGIGGFDEGLERAGLRCSWQVEIDDDARRELAIRWPSVPRFRDVRAFPYRMRSPVRYFGVDLIVGGDPCQENSGLRVAAGTSQPSLAGEFLRVVEQLRPTLVLRENPARVRPDAPWPWWKFAAHLQGIGYDVHPFRLRACCLGLDHRRERMFVFAALPDAHGQLAQFRGRRGKARFAPGQAEAFRQERERLRLEPRTVLRDQRHPVHAGPTPAAHGVPRRMDSRVLRWYGNAIPPAMAEWIGQRIVEEFGHRD